MRRTLWALILLAAGCSRSFTAPSPPQPLPQGAACQLDGGPCASGFCVDGVCCATSCTADQRCNDAQHLGQCTPRKLGDPCDAGAQCPSGFCADAVCCESACDGLCVQCDGLLSPGICTPVADNTDPRGSCPGGCSACFGGLCGPAVVGSDPRGECPAGQVCGYDQSCRTSDGGACSNNLDCAAGSCLAGSCVVVSIDDITTGLSTTATDRNITSAAVTPEGDEAIIVQELEKHDNGDGTVSINEDKLKLLFHRPNQDWRELDLYDLYGRGSVLEGGLQYAEAVFLGRTLFIEQYEPPTFNTPNQCGTGGIDCGLVAFQVFDNGTLGPREAVDLAAREDGTVTDTLVLNGWADPDGSMWASYYDQRGFHARQRSTDTHAWNDAGFVPLPSTALGGVFAGVRFAGKPAFVWAESASGSSEEADGFMVTDVNGTIVAQATAGNFPCTDPSTSTTSDSVFLFRARGPDPADGSLHFTNVCYFKAQYYEGTLSPAGALSFIALDGNANSGSSETFAQVVEDPYKPRLAEVHRASHDAIGIANLDATGFTALQNLDSNHVVGSMFAMPGQYGLTNIAYTVLDASAAQPPSVRFARIRL